MFILKIKKGKLKDMKKRVLLTSLLTIALCFSLVMGATFALFTSESKVNIAVTSGKVNVVATITELKTYSLGIEQQVGTFENGGEAKFDDEANLNLNLLTPGDAVSFVVEMKNEIDLLYADGRTTIMSDNELYEMIARLSNGKYVKN